jgi:NAD(P)-dependent dehydrogenase (short-subunit alcohol dehydrogenase family)
MDLNGRSAIVTGGAGGLGAATVRHLTDLGVPTVVLDVSAEAVATVTDGIGSLALPVVGSVLDEETVGRAVLAATDAGALSIVVNVAGGGIAARTLGRDKRPHALDAFRQVVELNLVGSFNVTRLAAVAMADNVPDEGGERGVVVHTASIAAFEGQVGQVAYAAAKGGIVGMTLPMARDFGTVGIRVVTIAPGTIGTPLMMTAPGDRLESFVSQVAGPRRLGRPEEYAMLVGHIIANPYLNGTVIRLDAGTRFAPK